MMYCGEDGYLTIRGESGEMINIAKMRGGLIVEWLESATPARLKFALEVSFAHQRNMMEYQLSQARALGLTNDQPSSVSRT